MEIVTEPEIRTAEQARRYAEELQLLLRSIGASDADMERGQMRVEANVSLRPRGTEPFGTRVEVKNMNSFRSVERAIAFEIERQAAALDAGEPLVQETRGWSEERGETYRMRVKETSDDYRYFPEPDLPPLHLDAAWLGRDPAQRCRSCRRPGGPATATSSGLSAYDAAVLVADPDADGAVRGDLGGGPGARGRRPSRTGSAGSTSACGTRPSSPVVVAPAELAAIDRPRSSGGRSPGRTAARSSRPTPSRGAVAATIIDCARLPPRSPTRGALGTVVDEVLAANPAAVADYRAGKAQAVGFLVGQVMKATRGQAERGHGGRRRARTARRLAGDGEA